MHIPDIHNLIKQTKTHVIIGSRFLRFCFLLLFLLFYSCVGCSITTRSWCSSSSSSWCRTNVADEITNVASLESFSKETRPESFNVDFGCTDNLRDLFSSDIDVVIVENESTVHASEFRGRNVSHF